MRDSFIFSLYRDSVEGARMQIFIPTIDQVGKPHLRYLIPSRLHFVQFRSSLSFINYWTGYMLQVLDQVCDLIVDVLRDQVVLRIFQACMV